MPRKGERSGEKMNECESNFTLVEINKLTNIITRWHAAEDHFDAVSDSVSEITATGSHVQVIVRTLELVAAILNA